MVRIPIDEQLQCAKRELLLRKNKYPEWVENGRMTENAANQEIACMAAIVHTLERVQRLTIEVGLLPTR